uniref:neuronal acetylcholine receptor subunit alpha-7-like isoform X6 n=1 Tax=Ciona intestinalis TaxID=7719 RepID=UPI000EF45DAC|nr:neuronal acetylcholine receptor subunit alpha-7-like isoform X6 [Ciona intestinalis]|eukprot:XP_026689355.1 neuronal acetylcholine receptor subunit alpha-7-like isoform X6 [Ciona intestinalis]
MAGGVELFLRIVLPMLVLMTMAQGANGSQAEKDLIQDLLRNYDVMVRPIDKYNDIINVSFAVTLQQIVDLDEKNQLLTTSMYMGWTWNDTYLKWNPDNYSGIVEIRLPAKKVWKPDILVYNSAVDSFDQMLQTNVVIWSTGAVEWLPPGLFKTTCDVDIRYFPFDEQRCTMKFGAWTYHGGMVDLALPDENAILDNYIPSGEWDLISMKGHRTSVKYECCPHPFVDVTYTIHMRRRTLFYGFNLILPCVLVCSLTILVFLLPADSGERITLGKYFACSIVMVTASVVCTVISLNFHHTTSANTNTMPGWIRFVFLNFLPRILRMKRPGENSFRRKFLDNQAEVVMDGKVEEYPLMVVRAGERLGNWMGTNQTELSPLNEAKKELNDVLHEVRFITSRMHNDDEDEKSALEWRFAATVLDRFCVIFFIIYFVVSTLFTIAVAPGVLLPPDN